MTGYGKAELNLENANFTIEVKALNSKQIDATVKMSSMYRDKEIGLRKLLSEKLQRGKIELSIWREKSESSSNYKINTEVIKDYHNQILKLQEDLNLKSTIWNSGFYELGLKKSDIIPTLLKMPDALVKGEEKSNENEWAEIQKAEKLTPEGDEIWNKLRRYALENELVWSDSSNESKNSPLPDVGPTADGHAVPLSTNFIKH